MDKSNTRLESLDGLRGFAALYIVLFHCLHSYPTGSQFLDYLIGYGPTSVLLFFCLSGFLIAHALNDASKSVRSRLMVFWVNRFGRIFPLWALILILHGILIGMPNDVAIANLTFTFGFLAYDPYWMPIYTAWSLFVEILFYIVFPLLALTLRTTSGWIIFFIASFCIKVIWSGSASSFGVPIAEHFIGRHPLANLSLFGSGICLRLLYDRTQIKDWLLEPSGRLASFFLSIMAVFAFFAQGRGYLFPPEMACVVLIVICLKEGTQLNSIMKLRWLRWIGVRCYAVYIAQATLLEFMLPYKPDFAQVTGLQNSGLEVAWLAIFMTILLLFSATSWRFLEFPCIRWARSIAARF